MITRTFHFTCIDVSNSFLIIIFIYPTPLEALGACLYKWPVLCQEEDTTYYYLSLGPVNQHYL